MTEQLNSIEPVALIEDLEPQEMLEVGGGLNIFDSIWDYWKTVSQNLV